MTALDRRSFLQLAGCSALAPTSFGGDFAPTLGVCRGPEHADTCAAAGAAYLEVSCGSWLVPAQSDEEFAPKRAVLTSAAVPARAANGFLPGALKSTGPDADHDGVVAYATTAFRRAALVGIDTITFGSSGSRSIPDDFPRADAELQFAVLLTRLGPIAADHGVTVAVEPLQRSETNFIQKVDEAARIVAIVDHPSVRVTADLFHMLREDDGPASIRRAGDLIWHAHVAEKGERTPPGQDGDDFREHLRALRDVGFAGRLSIECRWQDLARELPVGLAELERQLASL